MTVRRVLTYALLALLLSAIAGIDVTLLALLSSGALLSAVTHSNFSTLFSDLIAALFTGVVVGLILNTVQKRGLRAEMRYDWDLARAAFLDFLSTRGMSPNYTNLRYLGPIEEFVPFASRYPLGRWAREIQSAEMADVTELVRLLTNTPPIGEHLSKQTTADASRLGMPSETRFVFAGHVLGHEPDFVRQSLKMSESAYAKLDGLAGILVNQPGVAQAAAAYQARREEIVRLIERLRESLAKPLLRPE